MLTLTYVHCFLDPSATWLTEVHTHTRLTALFPGLSRWAGTRNVKPIWILLKQETVSGSDISWDMCKSAPRSRQITTPAPHRSVFYRPDALPAAQPTASKHWRHRYQTEVPDGLEKRDGILWTRTRAAIHWATRTTDFLPHHITTINTKNQKKNWTPSDESRRSLIEIETSRKIEFDYD